MLRLGQEQHVGGGEQGRAVEQTAYERPQVVVGHAEPLAIAGLEQQVRAQFVGNTLEMTRVQRHAALIRLERRARDPQCEWQL